MDRWITRPLPVGRPGPARRRQAMRATGRQAQAATRAVVQEGQACATPPVCYGTGVDALWTAAGQADLSLSHYQDIPALTAPKVADSDSVEVVSLTVTVTLQGGLRFAVRVMLGFACNQPKLRGCGARNPTFSIIKENPTEPVYCLYWNERRPSSVRPSPTEIVSPPITMIIA